MKDNIIKDFKLPNYIKGKTFAEASKAIDNKFKDRTDKISQETKESLLQRLADAQEYIKQMDNLDAETNNAAYGGYSNDMNMGGVMNAAGAGLDLFNTAFGESGIDPNSAQNINPNDVSVGGAAVNSALKGAQAGMAFGPLGAGIGGLVGGVAGLIGGGKKKKDALKARQNHDFMLHNEMTKDYADGGPIDYNAIDATFAKLPMSDEASLSGAESLDPQSGGSYFKKTSVRNT